MSQDDPTPEQFQEWSEQWKKRREEDAVREANAAYWTRIAVRWGFVAILLLIGGLFALSNYLGATPESSAPVAAVSATIDTPVLTTASVASTTTVPAWKLDEEFQANVAAIFEDGSGLTVDNETAEDFVVEAVIYAYQDAKTRSSSPDLDAACGATWQEFRAGWAESQGDNETASRAWRGIMFAASALSDPGAEKSFLEYCAKDFGN